MSTHQESKVTRHRERMRAAGLRPVQFWVPDTRSPEFMAQVREQCQSLKGDKAEADVCASLNMPHQMLRAGSDTAR